MEHLYNPDQMSEQEIKATFVARQALVDRLVTLIERQPEGAGVRHVVLVAPRGMGKTTMLLMVQFAVADRGLAPPWLPIRFPEELYGVTDLADFWLETLDNVSRTTEDAALSEATARLKARYPGSEQLQEATLALLRDWCRQNDRRLVLLVDNFHLILSQINDEQQNAALRHVLMNEGWVMLLGAAPSFFKEASRYDEPLYNFFQIERLERLTFDEMRALLLQRAAADGLTDFEKMLDANTTRLRVLEYFTGGNARLVLMLYQIITRSEVSEVRRGLELLLDQVTPYYKDKTEALPAQQRKILDHIARASNQTHEGVSPTEIALGIRLTSQVVSAQLKRLTEQGYVQPANLRGRNTFYTLSEPLYSLWYQMRFGRDARERMGWLVNFLKSFYTVEELGQQIKQRMKRFLNLVASGSQHEARSVSDYLRWLAEAYDDSRVWSVTMGDVIQGHIMLQDYAFVKEQLLPNLQLDLLLPMTIDYLMKSGCIENERAEFAINKKAQEPHPGGKATQETREVDKNFRNPALSLAYTANALVVAALFTLLDDKEEEAKRMINHALELNEYDLGALVFRGALLSKVERHEEALADYDKALMAAQLHPSRQPGDSPIYLAKFVTEVILNKIEDAVRDWYKALNNSHSWPVWTSEASSVLQDLVQRGHAIFVRRLLFESHTDEQFFPLARALDYLASGDEALIEKLTPEMRPIVEAVVAKFRLATDMANEPPA